MASPITGELELLEQLIKGDAESFRQIYEFYQGRVFLFAFRLTKSKSEAEEVVQEVFVKLWERREKIKIEKNFNAYLLTITKNLVIDNLKKASRDRNLQAKIYKNIQSLQDHSVDELIKKELERLQRQAIAKLSPRMRQVFLLSREEELTYEEIANRLGVSRNTVRNQVSEALKTIREFLADHPDIACVIVASMVSAKVV
ncbi:MAG: RNA polymerase sigma-70 factor [Bacteroidota bacterium]|nr:RNA polymerase sigma-70 factor [Bacteroidota bacterium]